jgi:hypothetical protein
VPSCIKSRFSNPIPLTGNTPNGSPLRKMIIYPYSTYISRDERALLEGDIWNLRNYLKMET